MKSNLLKITLSIIILIAPKLALSETISEARIVELEHTVQNLQHRVASLEACFPKADDGEWNIPIKPGNSQDLKNWRQLRRGMSENEVERLLGSPAKIMAFSSFSEWYFRGGTVNFNGSGKVDGWHEP
ncbi:outer membrane protein assembly factor BamE [Chlorobaculum thiosulfatiphilum]|jgi:hypothetical protein|uniref:Outer membrane protein assembly factor BamE n=1 Tax=Chlorobaculum thiosulfatiphilum TaxID=115852 RepID=A0A5C4S4D0_CHLTI|nr:outer membrane protein assembly factor BamE [Chlorobaculum thiosulfatiphilum]TNJ38353.1 outer membrane protein assembly factor BamE [Chlorobaculum thiosulfatiphilum]